MKKGIVWMVPLLLAAVLSLVLNTPLLAGIKIADNPGIVVGGTGEDFSFAGWHGWWVRYGSTHIDFTFTGINTGAITATHVLVNFDLAVGNHADAEAGLDGLVDIVINPGAGPGSTYTLANVLFDNYDPLNHVYLMGGGGTYATHASILVNKNYILGGTLVIRVVRSTDTNSAPVAPVCTNQPINMATQPPTIPPGCYEEDDAHTVHIYVSTTDSTGTVASNDKVTIWEMTDDEIIRDNPRVTVGGTGEDFNFAAWHGYWARYGSTHIDFTFSGLRPSTIPDKFVLVIFNLGVGNHSNGEEGLDGLVDFVINPGTSTSYTVASELLDNMDHLNHVYLMGGGGTYSTIAVLAINKYYIRPTRTLRIRVRRNTDLNLAPTAPACTNQPINMSTDPPTVPFGCYENNIAEKVHIYVSTWSALGQFADFHVATMYSKHYVPTAVHLTSYSAIEREGYVEVEWATAAELNNAGFNIYRSTSEYATKTKLNQEFIPARGNELEGAAYSFKDYDVTGSGEYYYWFEDVSLNRETRMSGPAVIELRDIPKTFSLAQNYPNPFNPVTEISYKLAADCHVKLEIYGVLGQRVATLVDEYQTAGNRIVRWDAGSELSSGIYFYRLQAGSYVEMRKMVLLK